MLCLPGQRRRRSSCFYFAEKEISDFRHAGVFSAPQLSAAAEEGRYSPSHRAED